MGCDIHGVIERKWNGRWVGWRTLDHIHTNRPKKTGDHLSCFQTPAALDRNYERFAALAGVRGDGPEARGLPDDASETSKARFEIDGDHTPSWLSLDDACRIFSETEYVELDDFDKKYPEYFYFGIEESDGPKSDFRLVFWFDS